MPQLGPSVLTSHNSSLEDSSPHNHKVLPLVDEVSSSNKDSFRQQIEDLSNEECLDDQFSKVFSMIESLSDKLDSGLKEANEKTQELSSFFKNESLESIKNELAKVTDKFEQADAFKDKAGNEFERINDLFKTKLF
eukprot:CAMPEP_0170480402 /NCGR_PEP_ID=MMETSP0208-20121228/1255_1 /TAXON_ID=197538 /ORGANISM="Strombidium inclinatum, Strain S3" /LENGTH=135 /DNA_ID=CAMNT_0010752943 /DNA_START=683 /DNA_END=1090 /DNA_ORIENTATION=-